MNSLQFRLGAGLFISLICLFVILWWMTGTALRYLGEENLIEHMAHDSESILAALKITPDKRLTLDTNLIEPVYRRRFSGHYYRVSDTSDVIKSPSLDDQDISVPIITEGQTLKIYQSGPQQQPLIVLLQYHRKQGTSVTVAVAEDLSPTLAKIAVAQQRYSVIALLLLVLLIGIQIFILRAGFKPLNRIQKQLKDLETGSRDQLDTDVPLEVAALVTEFNRLLQVMQQRLQLSRNSLGDLAHALKTPLTVIRQLAHEEVLQQQEELHDLLIKQTTNMQRLMDRVLKRARLAGQGPSGTKFDIQQEMPDLILALKRMYREKNLDIELEIPTLKTLPIDREDMLELAGNLIDNACKWAKSRIKVNIAIDSAIRLIVEDDGVGVPADDLARLPIRGSRLDEGVSGHGLGLSIARFIVEQHSGQLKFKRSTELGGFYVEAVLMLNDGRLIE